MTAVGVAAGAGAAQFGLVYGLGIVAWQPVRNGADNSLWLANLAWTLWIAATSTVLGAVYANHSGTRSRPTAAAGRDRVRVVDLAARIAIALAAAIGALVTVPLVMMPARAALRADTFRPEITAAAYAVVGVLAGLAAALVAVNVRVIAANVAASTGWVWILAGAGVADAVRAHRTAGTAQLAAWQFIDNGWFRAALHVPGAFLMLGAALLVGVFSALPADRRGDNRLGIAVSGAFGPLLVTAAYLLSAPKPTIQMDAATAYTFSAYAVIAGLAGSVFVAVLAPLRPRRTAAPAAPARAGTAPAQDSTAPARGTATPAYSADPAHEVLTPVHAAATPARETAPAMREAAPRPRATRTDDSDLTEWTRGLAGDPADSNAAYGRPESPLAPSGVDGVPQTATGWATVTRPVSPTVTQWAWSDVPTPREPRDLGTS